MIPDREVMQREGDLVPMDVAIVNGIGDGAGIVQIAVVEEDGGLQAELMGELLLLAVDVVVSSRARAVKDIE